MAHRMSEQNEASGALRITRGRSAASRSKSFSNSSSSVSAVCAIRLELAAEGSLIP